jgi:sugar/nucleoside kinase (ribokinase family)
LADDAAAALVANDLTRRGVDLAGPVIAGRTGVVVSLSEAGSHRSMLTDRGVGPLLTDADIRPGWLDGCSRLHLPAYSLTSQPVQAAAIACVAAARERSAQLSIDLSSTAAIAEYGLPAFVDLLRELRPELVFGNRAETDLVGRLQGTQMITKLGADGVVVAGHRYPALSTEAADTTGAGDAFAAGYLVGGVHLGLAAAARAVATMGAMP